jgi:CRISPR/Cas system endoribonuclease Cas6 (RAMP superfamily)
MLEERSQQSIGAILTGFTAGTALVCYGSFVDTSSLSTHLAKAEPLSQQFRSWEGLPFSQDDLSRRVSSLEWIATLENLASRLLDESVAPDPEVEKIITEHFWDLV